MAAAPVPKRQRLTTALFRLLAAYLACALGAGLLWQRPLVLFALYCGISVLLLWRWHSRSDLYFFFVPCVLGPLGESIAAGLGAWTYAQTDFLLPIWLPLAWGIAMLFMKKTAEVLLSE